MAPLDTTCSSDTSEAERSFAFGGVRFAIAPEPGLRWSVPAASRDYVLGAPAASCATVACAVRVDAALPELPPSAKALSVWESTSGGLRVRTAALELDVSAGATQFASSA